MIDLLCLTEKFPSLLNSGVLPEDIGARFLTIIKLLIQQDLTKGSSGTTWKDYIASNNQKDVGTLIDELKKILGNNLISDPRETVLFESDASPFHGEPPLAAFIPDGTDDLQKTILFCQKNKIPVVVRGGGTSLTGSSVSLSGSLVISTLKLNRILEISPVDRYVVVEPGVRLNDLNETLAEKGYFFPPDPGSSISATIGGIISTNAGGLKASLYGTTRNWILGLEILLPNGKTISTGGKVLKQTAGYDLTSLFIGAEGTLGIIIKAILKIWPVPSKTGRIVAFFRSVSEAGSAISNLKRLGINPLIAEFMDRTTMDAISTEMGITFPDQAGSMLMVDLILNSQKGEELHFAGNLMKDSGAISVKSTTSKQEMEQMYLARKGAYSSLLRLRKSPHERVIIGDIVVPVSMLSGALTECEAAAREFNLRVALFGHVGDGNIHANIYADPSDPVMWERVLKYQHRLGDIALRSGGSVSAEHGIGIEKKDLLLEEYKYTGSLYNLELIKGIKRIVDPNNIMNRGKVFD